MGKFFKRVDDLERELRRSRPEPSAEFVASMVDRVGRHRRPTGARLRLAFAGALTAMIVISLAAFGGLGYAASAVTSVAHVAAKVVTPSKHKAAAVKLTSAAAQYPRKIKICHFDHRGRGHDENISESSFPAHRGHGDHRGKCKKGGEFRPGSAAAKANAKKKGQVAGVNVRRGVDPSSTG